MSTKDGDTILFYHEGGVNVGDVDSKATRLEVPIGTFPKLHGNREKTAYKKFLHDRKNRFPGFIESLFKFYADLNFTYLEMNPIVVTTDSVIPLDLAAKLDSTAEFESGRKMGQHRVSQRPLVEFQLKKRPISKTWILRLEHRSN